MKQIAPKQMELRAYRPEDLQALAALDNLCFAAPFRFSKAAMKRFAETGNAIHRLAWVGSEASSGEQIAGFCIVHLQRERDGRLLGYVVTLDVAPAYRRWGVGYALMRAVEEVAAKRGAGEMLLHVAAGNQGAIRLYERLGYHLVRRDEGFYGAEGGDALVYRRVLAGQSEVRESDSR